MENITQPTLHAELEATAPWLNRLIRPDIASLRPQLSAHYFETLQENVCEYLNLQEETDRKSVV